MHGTAANRSAVAHGSRLAATQLACKPLLPQPAAARLAAPRATYSQQSSSGTIEHLRHITEDGFGLELLCQRPKVDMGRPPLLFVHGSYHAAWCWAEHFMPYFAERGYTTYAVSLRAQGNSDCMSNNTDSPIQVGGTLDSHAKDIAGIVADLPRSPVLVGHSFGGLMLQKYALMMAPPSAPGQGLPPVQGLAFLASAPPSGNKTMIWRFLQRDPILSLKITWGFVAKSFVNSIDACRELFFSPDLPRADLERYHKLLAACSPVRLIDLSDVNKQTPLPPPPTYAPPGFVLGGANDTTVDVDALKELAALYKVQPVVLPNMAHDIMLDTRWEQAAGELATWLQSLEASDPASRN